MPDQVENQPAIRKPYIKPEITHELMLETRAGSPLSALPEDPSVPFPLPPQR